jgi:hypothetical protein
MDKWRMTGCLLTGNQTDYDLQLINNAVLSTSNRLELLQAVNR